ncbi:MAG: trigger factor [Sedimentisphaerales bacterium]|nr:trigger factor [Sedimentisphaerales bacterium]
MADANTDAPKFNCTVDITDSGVWKKKISVVVPRSEVDAELERQFGDIRMNAQLPGFRKGRAPKRLVEKIFSKDVVNQAKFRLLARAFEQVEEGEDFDILGEPDLTPDDIVLPETGDFTFEYEVEVKPVFELPNLEGIKVEKQVAEVTDENIDSAVEMLCKRSGSMEEIEVAEAEDHVMTDIVLTIDGVAEPMDLKEWPLWVSPCTVKGIRVEDMASVLEGVKKGDVKKHSVTVSEDFKIAEWAGKKADMVITVTNIKRLKPAELTEEFIKSLGVADEAELRQVIAEDMESRLDSESRRLMAEQIYDYLESSTNFDLPVGITARYADRLVSRKIQELLNKGVPYTELEQKIEEIRASAGESAAKQMKMSFIMERICEKLEITATESEVNAFIAQLAYKYGRRPEKMRDELAAQNRIAGIRDSIAEEKAIAKILETANVVDKEPEAADKKDEKKAAKKPVRKKASETENN